MRRESPTRDQIAAFVAPFVPRKVRSITPPAVWAIRRRRERVAQRVSALREAVGS